MIEIFEDISQEIKDQASFVFEMALLQPNLLSAVNVLKNYTNTCRNEREKEFVEFYFNMRMENLLNENTNDQR